MRAALVALAPLVAAIVAAPVPVMRVTDGQTEINVRLDDGGRYVYAYVNSIYRAPVEERHLRVDGQLTITAVR